MVVVETKGKQQDEHEPESKSELVEPRTRL
jgi:hypothetical protein